MNKLIRIGSIAVVMAILLLINPGELYAVDDFYPSSSAQLALSGQTEQVQDTRVLKLEKYLKSHNSPLTDSAEDFIAYADRYDFGENWSMVAAIAGVESTFGKRIPHNSYNAWGWGIPTGHQSGIGFADWEEGIEAVTRGLKENYIDRGATTLASIGKIYAPPSNTWAGNVSFFMNQIESTTLEPTLSI